MLIRRGRRSVELTRLDWAMWRDEGITKRDLVDYYRAVSPALLPHLRNRPFTMKRHWQGPRSPFEWVKDAPPELPDWVPVSPQPAKSRGGALVRYPLVNDELTLLWMVEYGCIDLHVWPSRIDRPDRPDYVLFDLDPAAGASFPDVARAAVLVRDALGALGLESYPRTTGGDGMHVQVPIARRHTHEEARRFAVIVAEAIARTSGGLVTTEPRIERRRGVYVDTKMNGHGQQIVSVYSVRPRPRAPVSTPLRWPEVGPKLRPERFGMREVLRRVEKHGDLHEPVLRGGQRLDRALAAIG